MLICPEGVVKIAPRGDINKFVTSILCFSAIFTFLAEFWSPWQNSKKNLGRLRHYYLLLL